ncbi:MAG: hypothetical protein AAGD06_33705, partial [Acidobacteriota bacterium]
MKEAQSGTGPQVPGSSKTVLEDDGLRLPPRPQGAAWRHTLRFMGNPFPLMESSYRECGGVFRLRLLGLGEWVFLCTVDSVKAFYHPPEGVFSTGEIKAEAAAGLMLGVDSSLCLDGPAHLERQRRVLPLLNGRKALAQAETILRVTRANLERWPLGERFAFVPRAHRLALEIMVEVVFGDEPPQVRSRLADAFDSYSAELRSPLLAMPALQIDLGRFSPWGRMLAARERIRSVFRRVIAERRARGPGGGGGDVLGALMW